MGLDWIDCRRVGNRTNSAGRLMWPPPRYRPAHLSPRRSHEVLQVPPTPPSEAQRGHRPAPRGSDRSGPPVGREDLRSGQQLRRRSHRRYGRYRRARSLVVRVPGCDQHRRRRCHRRWRARSRTACPRRARPRRPPTRVPRLPMSFPARAADGCGAGRRRRHLRPTTPQGAPRFRGTRHRPEGRPHAPSSVRGRRPASHPSPCRRRSQPRGTPRSRGEPPAGAPPRGSGRHRHPSRQHRQRAR